MVRRKKRLSTVMTIIIAALASITLLISNHADSIFPPTNSTITGRAAIHDGDTIRIGSHKIRLEGIDAPELQQMCEVDGKPWQCGIAARAALITKIGRNDVQCNEGSKDRYKRVLGHCWSDGVNLNSWMVRNGHALAYRKYSSRYIPEEVQATLSNTGIHNTIYLAPWDWRSEKRKRRK